MLFNCWELWEGRLIRRQDELNAALDLDKNERQVAPSADGESALEDDGGGQAGYRRKRAACAPARQRAA
jgi:hypothetical protein